MRRPVSWAAMTRGPDALHIQLVALAARPLERCAAAWNEPLLTERLTIALGHRLRRSLGRCYPERGLVRIAPVVLALPAELQEEIVCHEAAHLVVYARHGRGRLPHGAEWGDLMREAGIAPRARIHVADAAAAGALAAERRPALYEHRCPVCHATRLARRRMTRWRCRACVMAGLPGLLEVSQRPPGEFRL